MCLSRATYRRQITGIQYDSQLGANFLGCIRKDRLDLAVFAQLNWQIADVGGQRIAVYSRLHDRKPRAVDFGDCQKGRHVSLSVNVRCKLAGYDKQKEWAEKAY
jgi:hypothetical protein